MLSAIVTLDQQRHYRFGDTADNSAWRLFGDGAHQCSTAPRGLSAIRCHGTNSVKPARSRALWRAVPALRWGLADQLRRGAMPGMLRGDRRPGARLVTAVGAGEDPSVGVGDMCCSTTQLVPVAGPRVRGADWHWAARWARRLAWISLVCVVAEGAVGLWQGVAAGSIALTAWALGSAPEALSSGIVIWRFSGSRTLSDTAEWRAQRVVALSFWLTGPYVAAESLHHLVGDHAPETAPIGIAVTALALLQMPILGWCQRKLGARLGSPATIGKGTQNYLCAAQAAAAFIGLAITTQWSGGWWLDPVIGLGIAGTGIWQGIRAWRGQDCGC